MSSPTSPPPLLRLLPAVDDTTDGRSTHRLVDAATRAAARLFDVPQWIAVAALRAASRAAGRPLREVATGLLLADRLPPSLVGRVRHLAPVRTSTRATLRRRRDIVR